MKKKALFFNHLPKERNIGEQDNFTFEPGKDIKLNLTRVYDSGRGWMVNSLQVVGIGRLLSYRKYEVFAPHASFLTSISEPVICLSIHCGSEGYIGYARTVQFEQVPPQTGFLSCMETEQTEHILYEGEHAYLDLFFRRESLVYLEDKPLISRILHQCAVSDIGQMIRLEIDFGAGFDKLLLDILDEIDTNLISAERFGYLCDSLLLTCMGEPVAIDPPHKIRIKTPENFSDARDHLRRNTVQKQLLQHLETLPREKLIKRYIAYYVKGNRIKRAWRREIDRIKHVKTHTVDRWKGIKQHLAKLYLEAAQFFFKEKGVFGLLSDESKRLRTAIVKSLEFSFKLQEATTDGIAFFYTLNEDPDFLTGLKTIEVEKMRQAFLHAVPADFMLQEELRCLGMLPDKLRQAYERHVIADIVGRSRSVELLYCKLIDVFYDTLEIYPDEGVRGSKVIDQLYSAFECNDLMALLQIEVEYLGAETNYVNKQDDEKLRWLIVALWSEINLYEDALVELDELSVSRGLIPYFKLQDKPGLMLQEVNKFLKFLKNRAEMLENGLSGIYVSGSSAAVLEFADKIVSFRK